MTAVFAWQELKKLAIIDHRLTETQKALKKAETNLLAAEKEIATHQYKIDEALKSIKSHQKNLDMLEREHRDLLSRISLKEQQLIRVSSEKEYSALLHEKESLQQQCSHIDDQCLTVLSQLEEQKQRCDTLQEELILIKQKNETQCAAETEKFNFYTKNIRDLMDEWTTAAKDVPPTLLDEYTRLRQNSRNPAVPIISGSCSGCFATVLPKDLQSVSARVIIRCRECFRFLFVPDETTTALSYSQSPSVS